MTDEYIDRERLKGLYDKYRVERTDGTSAPGQKHHGDEYFVLNLTSDPYAIPALKVYASKCRANFPELAADLDRIVAQRTGTFFNRQDY